jgi:hypothetical protein
MFQHKGRIAVIASCAFFALAETIFIADVICIVDETEVILLRISFKFAMFVVLRFEINY